MRLSLRTSYAEKQAMIYFILLFYYLFLLREWERDRDRDGEKGDKSYFY